MWLGISLPLTMIGAFFGFKQPVDDDPVRTNQIPRCVPPQVIYCVNFNSSEFFFFDFQNFYIQSIYMGPIVSMLMAGVLPFGAVFIELFFIFGAIWENEFYYLFGFLFLVFLILALAVAQIAVVMAYFQLCSEGMKF